MKKTGRYTLIAIYMLICNLWLYFSRLEIEYPLFILLNLISLTVGYLLPSAKESLKRLMLSKSRLIFVFISALYVSFATVGSKGVMYPVDRRISFGRLIVYILNFIWNLGLLAVIIHFVHNKTKSFKTNPVNNICVLEKLILIGVLLIPLIIMLVAFNPGICSYDTNLCLSIYAHNLKEMIDNQPFFYVLFLKCIISIVDSTYAIVIVQIILWIAVWMEALIFLNERFHIGFRYLLIIAVLISINCSNLFYTVTIWKDIPYTICLLLATILIAEMISDCDINIWFCIKLIISLVGVCLFRKNGPVAYLFTIIVIFYYQLANKKSIKKTMISILISIGIIWLIECPIYNAFGIQTDKDSVGTMYIGMSQELFAAYEYGEVSEETISMLTVLSGGRLEEYGYNPYWANAAYNLDVSPGYFIKCYLDSFIKNPRIMTKAILLRQDCLWNVFPGEDSWVNLVNYYGGWDDTVDWQKYYPKRNWTRFSLYIADIVSYPGKDGTMNIIFWRSGLHVALTLMIITAYFAVYGRCVDIYSCAPILGQVVSLFLSTGWADFRYYWSINVISLFIVILIISRMHYLHLEQKEGAVN